MSDADRAKAAEVERRLSYPVVPARDDRVDIIAAALAAERAKGEAILAAVLALADRQEAFCDEQQAAEISVVVPMKAGRDLLDRIFEAVGDAAYEAQPEERDWDVFVSASMPETPQVPTHLLRAAVTDTTGDPA